MRTLTFNALGTQCLVKYEAPDASAAQAFEVAARAWVERFEGRYSRFRPTSLLSRVNAAAGAWVPVDAEFREMLEISGALYGLTGGILDVTAGPLLQLWNYREPPRELPDAARVAEFRARVGWPQVELRADAVRLRPGMALDFGGWGKEWAVDAVAEIARGHGLRAALVDFGHDIRTLGVPSARPAWHVGLEDPTKPGTMRGSVALQGGKAIASSGDYLRGFSVGGRRFGHIVDPRTGWPVAHGLAQVTVVADTCFLAGVLSTTAFVLGVEQGQAFVARHPGAEACFVTGDRRITTRGFWNYVVT
jgi:thiamine biosynthesis lipoprotein